MRLLAAFLLAAIQITSVNWKDAPPSMPKGTRIAVLEGDPKQAGMFTIRLSVPKGSEIAPHWHPRAERVTVLSGKVTVAFGQVFDKAKGGKTFTAGGFYVNEPEAAHYLWFDEDTVLQLTCEGPWELHYLQ